MHTSIAIFGAGSWGTALAQTLARHGRAPLLWCRDDHTANFINRERENPKHLRGQKLLPEVTATADLAEAAAADLWVLATPVQTMRELLERLTPLLHPHVRLCNAAKGIEVSSLDLPSELVAQFMGSDVPFSALSGPSHAEEVVQGLPACLVAASRSDEDALLWQQVFGGESFRVYSSTDLVGVEVGGAVKNVIALASGFLHSRHMGDNAAAATVCRGLAEMTRLALSLGAQPLTLSGLAGVGDLMVTAFSHHSRNFRLGEMIGRGLSLTEATDQLGEVAEGASTVKALKVLSARQAVELPICDAVHRVLYEAQDPLEAVRELLGRTPKPEMPQKIRDEPIY